MDLFYENLFRAEIQNKWELVAGGLLYGLMLTIMYLIGPKIWAFFSPAVKEMQFLDQVKLGMRAAGTFHGFFIFIVTFYSIYINENVLLDKYNCQRGKYGLTIVFGMTYLLWELPLVLKYTSGFTLYANVLHHLIAIVGGTYILHIEKGCWIGTFRNLEDIAIPFANQWWFWLKSGNNEKDPAFGRIFAYGFIISYYVCRIFVIPLFYYQLHFSNFPDFHRIIAISFCIPMDCINVYFGYQIVLGYQARYRKPQSTENMKKDT